jgi:hypothetical protein
MSGSEVTTPLYVAEAFGLGWTATGSGYTWEIETDMADDAALDAALSSLSALTGTGELGVQLIGHTSERDLWLSAA